MKILFLFLAMSCQEVSISFKQTFIPVAKDIVEFTDEEFSQIVFLSYRNDSGTKVTSCEVSQLVNLTLSGECLCEGGVCSVKLERNLSFPGEGSFSYTVTSKKGTSNLAKGLIKKRSLPNTPLAIDIAPSNINEDQESLINISYFNSGDKFANTCNVLNPVNVIVSSPCSCLIGVCKVGVTGTPNYFGPASFSYTVTTTDGISNQAIANFTISPVPDLPITFGQNSSNINEDTEGLITLLYSDGDNDQATACTISNPVNLEVTSPCSCSGGICTVGVTGLANYYGDAFFEYSVVAGGDISNTSLVGLKILSVPDAPIASDFSPPAFNEDSNSIIGLTYSDAEGDLATSCSIQDLTNVTISTPCSCIAGACSVGVTGLTDYYGDASFRFTVTANGDISNTALVSLNILPVPDLTLTNPVPNETRKAHLWNFAGTCEDPFPLTVQYDSGSTGPTTISCSGGVFNFQVNFTLPGARSITLQQGASGNITSVSRSVIFNGPIEVKSSGLNSCTRFFDKTIQCWGNNSYGQLSDGTLMPKGTPVYSTSLTGIEHLGLGYYHTCAVMSNNTVKCWGNNNYGALGNGTTTDSSIPVNVTGVSSATAVDGGDFHTCALLSTGTVRCWGYNVVGQLGDGTSTNRTTPVSVSGLSGVIQIAVGSLHTCALLGTGSVKCWGSNSSGTLGNGNSINQSTPVDVLGISDAIAISSGYQHNCALLADRSIKCWGRNTQGELGDGTLTDRNVPVTVQNLTNDSTEIITGPRFSCAVNSGGSLKCWGINRFSVIGDRRTTLPVITTPVEVHSGVSLQATKTSSEHICAPFNDGSVKCWGTNSDGQLGNNWLDFASPSPMTTLFPAGFSALYPGKGDFHFAKGNDNKFYSWGINTYGELGTGALFSFINPSELPSLVSFTNFKGGEVFACGLDGTTIKCFGRNNSGQLGNNTFVDSLSPVTVGGVSNPIDYAVGFNHACVIFSNRTAGCWGLNNSGQLGNGTIGTNYSTYVVVTGLTNVKEITLGFRHSCALQMSGSIRCWGNGTSGQMGNGTNTGSSTSVSVSGLTTGDSLATGSNHNCAVLSNQTVRCWGYNGQGQLGDGSLTNRNSPTTVSGLSNVSKIALSSNSSCALITDGTVKCWGSNSQGELGIGTFTNASTPQPIPGLSGVINITAGANHFCAHLSDTSAKCWGSNAYGNLGIGNSGNTHRANTLIFLE